MVMSKISHCTIVKSLDEWDGQDEWIVNSIGASHHNDLAQHTEYQSDQ